MTNMILLLVLLLGAVFTIIGIVVWNASRTVKKKPGDQNIKP